MLYQMLIRTILVRGEWESFFNQVTFVQRSKRTEGVGHVAIWEKRIPRK